MAADDNGSSALPAILDRAIREGGEGRGEIMDRLAAMPVEELASLPPSALAMIGPGGLAELARRRADLAGLAPKMMPETESGATIRGREARNGTRSRGGLFPALRLACGIVAAALSLELLGPLALSMREKEPLSHNAGEWPRCVRLDRFTDGCVYRTGGGRLTLERAAVLLAVDPDGLRRLNPHLSDFDGRPVPAGSSIVVLRDLDRIERNRR